MAISYPYWKTLKQNIVTILEAISDAEEEEESDRAFLTCRDRWRPYIEAQHDTALVNVMVQNVSVNAGRSGTKRNKLDEINVFVDMYVVGEAGDTLPVDEATAQRLDLLINQVRVGLTSLAEIDLGFAKDDDYGKVIDWDGNMSLSVYDQEGEQSAGQYAPARWSFTVYMPYIPTDDNTYYDLDTLAMTMKTESAAELGITIDYTS